MTATASTGAARIRLRRTVSREQLRGREPLALAALLLVTFVYLTYKGRANNFYYDEWGWIVQRHTGLHWILASYNDHLCALPLAVYQLLFRTIGLSHYGPYRLLGTLAHLGLVAAVFFHLRHRIGALALLAALPLAVLGSGWDYVIWPVSFGFVASIGLSVAAFSLLRPTDGRRDALACLLLTVGVCCSEFAVVFLAGLAVELGWRGRMEGRLWRRAWVWALPLALYLLWWAVYHEPSAWRNNLTAAPAYMADMAASSLSGLLGLGLNWGRPLLIAALALLAIRIVRPGALTPRLAALLIAAASFWGLVALGRAQLGTPDASRYVYTGAVLVALIAGEAAPGLKLRGRALGIAALVALFGLLGNLRVLSAADVQLRVASQTVSAELSALELAPSPPPKLLVDPHYAPVLQAFSYLVAIRAIGSSPALPAARLPSAAARARAAADGVLLRAGELTSTLPSPAARPAGAPPTVLAISGGVTRPSGSCVLWQPSGPAASFDVRLPSAGLTLSTAPGAATGAAAQVLGRRFGDGYPATPVAAVTSAAGVSLHAAADRSPVPWTVRVSAAVALRACALG